MDKSNSGYLNRWGAHRISLHAETQQKEKYVHSFSVIWVSTTILGSHTAHKQNVSTGDPIFLKKIDSTSGVQTRPDDVFVSFLSEIN